MSFIYHVEYSYINGITEKSHAVRDEHMAYRESIDDRLVLAGPIVGSDNLPMGSILVVRADDLAEAQKIAEGEPFVREGVSEVVAVRLMRVAKVNSV